MKLLGERLRKEGSCRGLDVRAAKFVSRLSEFQASEFQSKDQMVQSIEEVLGGERALKPERTKKPKPAKTARERRRGKGNWRKGTRLHGRWGGPIGGWNWCWSCPRPVYRVEWAKQLVHNGVRSPHTQRAYAFALEQFFVRAAGCAISRKSVQGYVTGLGEIKFSPSTINQRLAAIRKLATEPSAVVTSTARRRRRLCRSPV